MIVKIRKIKKWQLTLLKESVRKNTYMILDSLYHFLGLDGKIHPDMGWWGDSSVYVAIYSHALEEYGKLVYLETLSSDSNQIVTIEYRNIFCKHYKKIDYATKALDPSLWNFPGLLTLKKQEVDVGTRMNILHTDIAKNGDPTLITTEVISKMKFRNAVTEFRKIVSKQGVHYKNNLK